MRPSPFESFNESSENYLVNIHTERPCKDSLGQPGQDSKSRTAGTGQSRQLGWGSQDKVLGQDRQDKAGLTRWSEHDSKDRTGRQENLDRTARTGQSS